MKSIPYRKNHFLFLSYLFIYLFLYKIKPETSQECAQQEIPLSMLDFGKLLFSLVTDNCPIKLTVITPMAAFYT
ncbi:hypothetical protein KUTeg_005475 [Tegillarca granosa]|uniref:Uncharacterized protein n=1 Tax=Tegillarca granosa TaxID=220873 RepID=A0ABQ9FJU9_TEGGR|nr:hypothetical protein KUTeg_005475 [Tegillarca granosa]